MVGLIILIILVPLVLLILLISIYNRTGEQQRLLESIHDQLKKLNTEIASLKTSVGASKVVTTPAPVVQESFEKIIIPETPVIKQEKPAELPKEVPNPLPVWETTFAPVQKDPVHEDEIKWLPKNTDWEKFIGENLANKIGIAVLVLGIAFFVKYAIDKNWITETGRVIVGLISGGILIGFAHYFRNTYRSFSSVLVGGGLTVFYFSIAFAFHQYQLIGQTTAFIIMVVISGLGVLLSLFYDRQELAILATIGGFVTPFLVSTGQENYIALFTYLCILNSGLMALAWFKRWPSINSIALFFTTIIYGGWLIKRTIFEEASSLPYKDALLFATLFYILFVAMNIINSIRLKNKFGAFDFIIVLATNFLYYVACMFILSEWNDGSYKGTFTALLGITNLILTLIFYPRKNIDRNFVSLLTGLTLSFISLAVPVQFKGNHIVLFWIGETIILYWLYTKTKIQLLRYASFIVAILTLLSLLLTWTNVYLNNFAIIPILLNKGFITTSVVAIALFLYHRLMPAETAAVRRTVLITAISIAYLAGVLEMYYQFSSRYTDVPIHTIYLLAYTFIVAVLLLKIFRKDAAYSTLKLFFTIICFAFYLFGLAELGNISLTLLTKGNGWHFAAHWLAAGILLWMLYDLCKFFFKRKEDEWIIRDASFAWLMAASIILVLSIEMYQVILWSNYKDRADWIWWENLYYKAGLSMLWGICSFAMMWLGMKKSYQPLRIISLTLFTITLGKLFLYDIRNIPPGGKIVAFILLGILLLAVSFMYQRLKKIIIDNKTDQ